MATTIIDGLVLDGSTTGPQGLEQNVFTDVLATKPVTVTDLTAGDVITWNGTEFVNQIPAASDPNVVVLRSVDQTINSVKTFSVSPQVPTAAIGDSSTTAASTAFVKAQNYLVGNQTITYTGDATGQGTTAVTLTLANSGVTAGTYNDSATAVRPFTVDAKGRITSIGAAVTITPAWSSIAFKPTTVSGYAISDVYTKTEVDAAVSAGVGQITAGTGLTKTGNTLALTGQALSFHNLGTLGFAVRTATDTITARQFAVSGSGITVANPAGTAGDPTFSLTAALSQIGALTPAADRISYYTGASTAALATLTSFARTLLDDVDAATARTTLGLGSVATQSSSQINITGGSISGLTTFDAVTIDCGTF